MADGAAVQALADAGEATRIVARTPRLTLRHLREDDAPFMLALVNDAQWLKFIGDRGVRTLDEARAYLRDGALASYARHGFGLYAVASSVTGETLGICGLVRRETLPEADLGFAFLPAFRRHGYAREAAEAALRLARDAHGMSRVLAIVAPDNVRSVALLEKLGFRHEKTLRIPPKETDTALYALTLRERGAGSRE